MAALISCNLLDLHSPIVLPSPKAPEVLGVGGNSTVLLHQDGETFWALKEANKSLGPYEAAIAQCGSVYVAQGFGVDAKSLYTEILEPLGTEDIAPENALNMLSFLCKALDDVSKKMGGAMVHRDIKFSNILKKAGSYHLIDWGLSNFADKMPALTDGFYTPEGTPQTIAPEAVSLMPISEKQDTWAIGILLYQMLSKGREHPLLDEDQKTPVDFIMGTLLRLHPDEESNPVKDRFLREVKRVAESSPLGTILMGLLDLNAKTRFSIRELQLQIAIFNTVFVPAPDRVGYKCQAPGDKV